MLVNEQKEESKLKHKAKKDLNAPPNPSNDKTKSNYWISRHLIFAFFD